MGPPFLLRIALKSCLHLSSITQVKCSTIFSHHVEVEVSIDQPTDFHHLIDVVKLVGRGIRSK